MAAGEMKLGQVLVNLLLNAAQSIEPGNVLTNEVSIETRSDPSGRVVITVSDSGAGMSPETLEHMFEPFFTTKAVGVGTGLGLSICHGIVTSLHGELQAESELGKGSTFCVLLPASVPIPLAQVQPALPLERGRRARILLVDDESTVQRTIRRAPDTHEVVAADSGQQALDLLDQGEAFDLILSDMMMPDMTEMQFYEALLQTFPDVAKRVVFVSGGGLTPQTRDFLAAISNPRVEKPFSVSKLRSTVDGSKTPFSSRPRGLEISACSAGSARPT